jgi:hypothetical protein
VSDAPSDALSSGAMLPTGLCEEILPIKCANPSCLSDTRGTPLEAIRDEEDSGGEPEMCSMRRALHWRSTNGAELQPKLADD